MSVLRRHRVPDADRGRVSWADRQTAAAELEAYAVRVGPDIDGHPALSTLGTRDQALRYLHARWVRLVGAAIDGDLEADPGAVAASAWSAWRRVAKAQPGLAAVLRHYAGDPAVRMADDRHRALLSAAAGCRPGQLPCFDPRIPPTDQKDFDEARLLMVLG